MVTKDNVWNFLKNHRRFVVITHEKPDGDGLGSALAMAIILRNLKKEAQVILPKAMPEKYRFLPQANRVLAVDNLGEFCEKKRIDACAAVDCGSLTISGFAEREVKKLPVLNIDHHPTNNQYGDINYVKGEAAATCEILYDLIKSWKLEIDKELATLLFAGIFTDTGGFQHSNTSLKVLAQASELLKCGVQVNRLSKNLYNTRTMASLKILGLALSRIVFNPRLKIVYSVITQKDMENYRASDEDLEGVVNLIASFPQATASMLIYEVGGRVKGSLRTESDRVSVAELAKNLGGGGHHKAAGFKIPGRLKFNRGWMVV